MGHGENSLLNVSHWNIQGFTQNKFKDLVEACSPQVISLVETWSGENIIVKHYSCFSANRKMSRNGRYYGGVSLFVSDVFLSSNDVIRLKSESCNLVWVRISRGKRSHVFCSVYIPPESSSFSDEDTWEIFQKELHIFLTKFPADGFILLGDFNAYTGELQEPWSCQFEDHTHSESRRDGMGDEEMDEIPPRTSKDHRRKNRWGSKLLEICGKENLIIVNGRIGEDKERGEFTCFFGKYPSVVDYIVVNKSLWPDCACLGVVPVLGSDHLPIRLSLNVLKKRALKRSLGGFRSKVLEEGLEVRDPLRLESQEEEKVKVKLLGDEFQAGLEKGEILANEGKIEESLKVLIDSLYEVGVTTAQKQPRKLNGFFDGECVEKKSELVQTLELLRQCSYEEREYLYNMYKSRRKEYKKLLKVKKYKFQEEEAERMKREFRNSNKNEFWKIIKKSVTNASDKTSIPPAESWPEFIESKMTEREETDSLSRWVVGENLAEFPLKEEDYKLLQPFTGEEIWNSLKKMRGTSAPGVDGIPTRLWKWSRVYLLPLLSTLFSSVLSKLVWPQQWNISIVLPLFKKGDRALHKNYRGIHLGNSLSKLFCKVLVARLDSWLKESNKLIEIQAGFREDYSGVDQIFILYGLIRKYMRKRDGRLYAAFLDLRGAFDEVSRDLLVEGLIKLGLPRRFVGLVVKMYLVVRMVFKVGKSYSRAIVSRLGVKQGCTISPRLFSLYLNDIEDYMVGQGAPTLNLSAMQVFALLFADDIVLVAKDGPDLQKLLGMVSSYLDEKRLVLNVTKSVVMVFRQHGNIEERFSVGEEVLKVVEDFVYLGCKFTSNGRWKGQIDYVASKGLRAIWLVLKSSVLKVGLTDLRLQKRIFQTKLASVMSFAAEVWGMEKADKVDRLQLMYFKRLMGVSDKFNHVVLKGDLGLLSLRVGRLVRIVNYWERIINLPSRRLVKNAYEEMLVDGRKSSWPNRVKETIDRCGFSEYWNEGKGLGVEVGLVAKKVKDRLIEQEIQRWQNQKSSSASLGLYGLAKEVWGEEVYFKAGMSSEDLRWVISVRGNFLGIGERRKYIGNYRIKNGPYQCPMCGEEEDLIHFMGTCQELRNLRREVFSTDFGGVDWFEKILKSRNFDDFRRLGKFVRVGMAHRETFLMNCE